MYCWTASKGSNGLGLVSLSINVSDTCEVYQKIDCGGV